MTSADIRVILALSLLLLAAAGCGPKMASVSGTVTLNGKPLPNAAVTFEPKSESADFIATGVTDLDGWYELVTVASNKNKVILGQHHVTIATGFTDDGADERTAIPRELLPPEYQDGSVLFEVVGDGASTADFNISTKQRR